MIRISGKPFSMALPAIGLLFAAGVANAQTQAGSQSAPPSDMPCPNGAMMQDGMGPAMMGQGGASGHDGARCNGPTENA